MISSGAQYSTFYSLSVVDIIPAGARILLFERFRKKELEEKKKKRPARLRPEAGLCSKEIQFLKAHRRCVKHNCG
jgi:hypothetical protein